MEFLTGEDYPNLCPQCRDMIDSVVEVVAEGEDTDDNEAPIMFVYDNALFCGGRECVNRTPTYRVRFEKESDGGRHRSHVAYNVPLPEARSAAAHYLRERKREGYRAFAVEPGTAWEIYSDRLPESGVLEIVAVS